MSRCLLTLFATLGLLAFLVPVSASATVSEATATPFTGAPLSVLVTIDDGIDPGNLVITLEVVGDDIGDLRGLFLHVVDESLLAGMYVSGTDVTDSSFDANRVIRVGGGNNLQGGGSPCKCDIGIEFGSSGMGKDDLQTVTFTLSHLSQDLDVSIFAEQEFGVRATSVGPIGGSRDGSSKLSGVFPVVPEPTTALFMMLGLAGLGVAGGRREPQSSGLSGLGGEVS